MTTQPDRSEVTIVSILTVPRWLYEQLQAEALQRQMDINEVIVARLRRSDNAAEQRRTRGVHTP